MNSFKTRVLAILVAGLFAGLALSGCRPHRDHDDYDGGDHHDSHDDPNLHDDGGHHDDDTAVPGYLYSIGTDVENDGDDWSGGFWVDFYASENSSITTSDWKIGSVYVGSLWAGEWANADLLVSFPDIPPGRYYVGAIIDATHVVSESNESDNIVVFSGPSLLVLDEFEPNDDDWQSHYLGGPDAFYALNATIHEDGDEDWFSFWQDNGFNVDVLLSGLPDDYDVEVYDDGGGLIDMSSNSGTAVDHVNFDAPYTGFYYIRIRGSGSDHDEDDTYALDVDLE
ncbi:MAG: CARDB domain-containing protein [Planctomycetota bacterium]